MAVDVIQRIKEFKPSESYVLTFNIDFQYFEGLFLPMLQRLGCNKNIVILDNVKFNEEIKNSLPSIRKLGHEYAIVPIYSNSSFHPKIYFFKKEVKDEIHVLCILGSGNLTYPGLNSNYELFIDIEWKGKDLAPIYLKSIWDYIINLLDTNSGETVGLFRQWLMKGYPEDFQLTEDIDDILVFEFPDSEDIFKRYIKEITPNSVEKLFITAPFYDSDLSALSELINQLNPENVEIMIQPSTVSISAEHLKKLIFSRKNINLLLFNKKNQTRRYLHAKLIVAISNKGDHVLFGSANISDLALFGKGKKGNYEVCVYKRFPKNSIVEKLDMYENSKALSIDILQEKEIEKIEEKTIKTPEYRILNAEFYFGKYLFTLSESYNLNSINLEFLFNNGEREQIEAHKKDSEDRRYIVDNSELNDALFVRIYSQHDNGYTWIPIFYFHDIDKQSTRSFGDIDKIKNMFLSATTAEDQSHYLNRMIDYLIEPIIKEHTKQKKISRRPRYREPKDEQDSSEDILISIEDQMPIKKKSKENHASLRGFDEILDYLIGTLRRKQIEQTIIEEMTEEEEEEEMKEGMELRSKDQKKTQITEDKQEIDDIQKISYKLKRRRTKFINVSLFGDIFTRICFYSIVALPHIPQLHKYYFEQRRNERIPCVYDKEWEDFVVKSINIIGSNLFAQKTIDGVWPFINLEPFNVRVFKDSVASTIYSCATVYPFVKRRSENFDKIGFYNCLIVNRFHILCAALVNIFINSTGSNSNAIRETLDEISELFMCKWLHIEESLNEFFHKICEFAHYNFKTNTIRDIGELNWDNKRGFILKAKGLEQPLWKF